MSRLLQATLERNEDVMIESLAAILILKRIVRLAFNLATIALVGRVGMYWLQHNTLPPLSMLVDDAVGVWTWLESTGVVQWVLKNAEQWIGWIQ